MISYYDLIFVIIVTKKFIEISLAIEVDLTLNSLSNLDKEGIIDILFSK